ncbi:MAG: hypothetical protein HGB37_04865, partial [Candidatus Moranbacteria bacterium]|nr:hypothetical protein [Candidatus Moranbacteria bacterium]
MLAAAEAIWYAKKSEQSDLRVKLASVIRSAFETNDPAVMLAAAEAIWYAKKSEQSDLRVKLASVIRSAFETNDPAVMLAATKAIGYAEESEQSDLRVKLASVIRSAFETNDPAVMLAAAKMIRYAKKSDWAELYALALERIGPSSVEGPLYEKTLVGFGRENFKKTGSETTLLGMVAGNDLKGKIIVRKFEMSSFLGWKRLYDDHAFWKGNGFDYVPIEPIVSFSVRKTGKVDVYSGVLDFSLLECRERGLKTWESELEEDRDKIIDAIKEGGYNHGHPHDKNFCLRFCRKDDGNIDYSKKPRIYLIDFDQVSSSKSRK